MVSLNTSLPNSNIVWKSATVKFQEKWLLADHKYRSGHSTRQSTWNTTVVSGDEQKLEQRHRRETNVAHIPLLRLAALTEVHPVISLL